MALTTPAFLMADKLTGGRLEEIFRSQITDGRSPEQVSRTLYADYGIDVSGSTLRRWFPEIVTPAAEDTESVA